MINYFDLLYNNNKEFINNLKNSISEAYKITISSNVKNEKKDFELFMEKTLEKELDSNSVNPKMIYFIKNITIDKSFSFKNNVDKKDKIEVSVTDNNNNSFDFIISDGKNAELKNFYISDSNSTYSVNINKNTIKASFYTLESGSAYVCFDYYYLKNLFDINLSSDSYKEKKEYYNFFKSLNHALLTGLCNESELFNYLFHNKILKNELIDLATLKEDLYIPEKSLWSFNLESIHIGYINKKQSIFNFK